MKIAGLALLSTEDGTADGFREEPLCEEDSIVEEPNIGLAVKEPCIGLVFGVIEPSVELAINELPVEPLNGEEAKVEVPKVEMLSMEAGKVEGLILELLSAVDRVIGELRV